MTDEERKLALHCLKASSDYHSEVCEECIKYPNCDHTRQDDVTETIIKALEQKPKTGHWIKYGMPRCEEQHYKCTSCGYYINFGRWGEFYAREFKYCPHCGAEMKGEQDEV